MNLGLGYVILILVVYVLAVGRLTRLVNADSILDRPRAAVEGRSLDAERSLTERGRWSTLSEFLACPWCVGMWFALGGAVPVVLIVGWPWWAVLPVGLAGSQVVGMAAPLFGGDEIEFESVEVS